MSIITMRSNQGCVLFIRTQIYEGVQFSSDRSPSVSVPPTDDLIELNKLLVPTLAPIEPPPARRAALRTELLARVRADRDFVTVQRDDGTWRAAMPGIEMKILHDHGDSQSYMLRLAPGATIPAHAHATEELCIVLEGDVQLGGIEASAGTYHLAMPRTSHREITTRNGCVLFLRSNLYQQAHHA